MSFGVTLALSDACGIFLLSNLNSQNPDMSGFAFVSCAAAEVAQRAKTKMKTPLLGERGVAAPAKVASRLFFNGRSHPSFSKEGNFLRLLRCAFIGVARVAQWIAVVTDRWNHTTLRTRTYPEDPCNRCTHTCAA